jgi:U32 family peptidase
MLPQLVAVGVDSLKIEGRMKSIFYVGGVVRIYRAALDYLAALPEEAWRNPSAIRLPEVFMEEICRTGTRGVTDNFISSRPGSSEMLYDSSRAMQSCEPVAVIVQSGKESLVEVRNQVSVGDEIEYMERGIAVQPLTLVGLRGEEGNALEKANPGNRVYFTTVPEIQGGEPHAILRRQKC